MVFCTYKYILRSGFGGFLITILFNNKLYIPQSFCFIMSATKPFVLNVYGLVPVYNVCNQTLREVFRFPNFSMAHVMMDVHEVSQLHEHRKMKEFYFITQGDGIFFSADKSFRVGEGGFFIVPKNTPHKLRNLGKERLEHLVFASPPFNSKDVFELYDDISRPMSQGQESDKKPFTALDGAVVYELDSAEERQENGFGFAYGHSGPLRKAKFHFHNISDEVYYVLSGEGKVRLDNLTSPIKKGSVIYVPIGVKHGLENTSEEELRVLCFSTPEYKEGDFILTE